MKKSKYDLITILYFLLYIHVHNINCQVNFYYKSPHWFKTVSNWKRLINWGWVDLLLTTILVAWYKHKMSLCSPHYVVGQEHTWSLWNSSLSVTFPVFMTKSLFGNMPKYVFVYPRLANFTEVSIYCLLISLHLWCYSFSVTSY